MSVLDLLRAAAEDYRKECEKQPPHDVCEYCEDAGLFADAAGEIASLSDKLVMQDIQLQALRTQNGFLKALRASALIENSEDHARESGSDTYKSPVEPPNVQGPFIKREKGREGLQLGDEIGQHKKCGSRAYLQDSYGSLYCFKCDSIVPASEVRCDR